MPETTYNALYYLICFDIKYTSLSKTIYSPNYIL